MSGIEKAQSLATLNNARLLSHRPTTFQREGLEDLRAECDLCHRVTGDYGMFVREQGAADDWTVCQTCSDQIAAFFAGSEKRPARW